MKKLEQITPEQWDNVHEFNRTILEDFLTNSTELSPRTRKAYESNLKIWFVMFVKKSIKENFKDMVGRDRGRMELI